MQFESGFGSSNQQATESYGEVSLVDLATENRTAHPVRSEQLSSFEILPDVNVDQQQAGKRGEVVGDAGSTIHAEEGSRISALRGSTVYAGRECVVAARPGSTVYAEDGSTVYVEPGANIFAKSGSQIHLHSDTSVNAASVPTVHQEVGAAIQLDGSATGIKVYSGGTVVTEGGEISAYSGATVYAKGQYVAINPFTDQVTRYKLANHPKVNAVGNCTIYSTRDAEIAVQGAANVVLRTWAVADH